MYAVTNFVGGGPAVPKSILPPDTAHQPEVRSHLYCPACKQVIGILLRKGGHTALEKINCACRVVFKANRMIDLHRRYNAEMQEAKKQGTPFAYDLDQRIREAAKQLGHNPLPLAAAAAPAPSSDVVWPDQEGKTTWPSGSSAGLD